MFSDDDLLDLYADTGEPVSYRPAGGGAALAGFGHFTDSGAEMLAGEVVGSEPALRYPLASFSAVQRNGVFEIGARDWRVRSDPRLINQGREAVVQLELVP